MNMLSVLPKLTKEELTLIYHFATIKPNELPLLRREEVTDKLIKSLSGVAGFLYQKDIDIIVKKILEK